jgi:hypothetical protein
MTTLNVGTIAPTRINPQAASGFTLPGLLHFLWFSAWSGGIASNGIMAFASQACSVPRVTAEFAWAPPGLWFRGGG